VATPTNFQVGDLVVDAGRAQVLRGDTEVPLPKLSFDLLVALAEAAPRVVTLDELMTRVWRDVVVSPETISQRVKLLRDAIGDDPRHPRYVASVRGRGYRLVAPVTPLPAAASGAPQPVPATAPIAATAVAGVGSGAAPPRRPFVRLAVYAMAAVLVPAAAALWWHRSQPLDVAPPATERVPEPAAELPPPRSVAVLPFDNLSPGAEGEALALGIAETVLHLLAGLSNIDVTARTSSFALHDGAVRAPDIGRRLKARYLLQGSVQREAERLRVTAQLIEASSGGLVWSARYDRRLGDVFAVQDEIATNVVQALQLSVDAAARGRLARQGTERFDAYLEYLHGRALLGTGRVADVGRAVGHFERAVELDSHYSDAYVGQARAELFVAEYEPAEERYGRFEEALRRARGRVARAIALDAENADAYLARAHFTAFDDLGAAETDYRRALELNPNAAEAYAGLAAVLYETPARRDEAFALLERAHNVTMSVYLHYERGDVDGPVALLSEALKLDPQYQPALTRLGEIRLFAQGRVADAVLLGERALALDPASESTRRALIRAYLAADDPAAATELAEDPHPGNVARRTPILLFNRDWIGAGESAYRSLEQGTSSPIDLGLDVAAIRMHARTTGAVGRARRAVEAPIASVAAIHARSRDRPCRPALAGGRPRARWAAPR
jgi:TolB-like protein/DNA-binding winged helix-turn-helix (wHTH) protein/Flp pilus assembly protein TadD